MIKIETWHQIAKPLCFDSFGALLRMRKTWQQMSSPSYIFFIKSLEDIKSDSDFVRSEVNLNMGEQN